MHLTRSEAIRALPLPRKGTKYIARGLSHSTKGVPVVIAVRDLLGLAKTAREVRQMANQKLIKINGREVRDIRTAVKLFDILHIGKSYRLVILPTGRFSLEETKENFKICRVIGKKMVGDKKIQINFHDGSNKIYDDKASIGDTFEIDFDGKIKKVIPLEKGKDAFIISGRSIGNKGKILEVSGANVRVKLENGKEVELGKSHITAL